MTSQARDADRRGNPGNEDEGGEGDVVDGGRNGLGDNDGVGERVGEAGDRREGGDGGRAPLGGGDDDGGGRRNQAREGIEDDEDRNEGSRGDGDIGADDDNGGDAGGGEQDIIVRDAEQRETGCLLYTSPSPRDATLSRMPSSA